VTTGRTGGTTGVPLAFALDHARVMFDHALIERHWGWAGCRPRDRVALVRGLTLVPASDRTGAFWRHDYVNNRVYVSGFHMSADRLPEYVERLREWRVPYYSAYPSTIAFLARYLERENLTIPARAIFTSSEVLTPTERAVIERRFECRVWDRYGTGERLVVSQQCEHGSYHQNVEYGLLEVVSPEGEPVPTGVRGALLHTGLTNLSMPLLRYAIEDVGYVVDGQCVCGRGLAMMGAVDGRKDDAIITSDGRVMPQAGLDQIHEFVERMERCQLVQERVGEVIVRVQPRAGFDASDAEELVAQLRKRVGEGTVIRVVTVDALELTATGKERFIVSRLTAEEREEADRAALRS
jgi:phenylacetate-CoA ligase